MEVKVSGEWLIVTLEKQPWRTPWRRWHVNRSFWHVIQHGVRGSPWNKETTGIMGVIYLKKWQSRDDIVILLSKAWGWYKHYFWEGRGQTRKSDILQWWVIGCYWKNGKSRSVGHDCNFPYTIVCRHIELFGFATFNGGHGASKIARSPPFMVLVLDPKYQPSYQSMVRGQQQSTRRRQSR